MRPATAAMVAAPPQVRVSQKTDVWPAAAIKPSPGNRAQAQIRSFRKACDPRPAAKNADRQPSWRRRPGIVRPSARNAGPIAPPRSRPSGMKATTHEDTDEHDGPEGRRAPSSPGIRRYHAVSDGERLHGKRPGHVDGKEIGCEGEAERAELGDGHGPGDDDPQGEVRETREGLIDETPARPAGRGSGTAGDHRKIASETGHPSDSTAKRQARPTGEMVMAARPNASRHQPYRHEGAQDRMRRRPWCGRRFLRVPHGVQRPQFRSATMADQCAESFLVLNPTPRRRCSMTAKSSWR